MRELLRASAPAASRCVRKDKPGRNRGPLQLSPPDGDRRGGAARGKSCSLSPSLGTGYRSWSPHLTPLESNLASPCHRPLKCSGQLEPARRSGRFPFSSLYTLTVHTHLLGPMAGKSLAGGGVDRGSHPGAMGPQGPPGASVSPFEK